MVDATITIKFFRGEPTLPHTTRLAAGNSATNSWPHFPTGKLCAALGGEDDSAPEPDLFFEFHHLISNFHFWFADFGDSIDHLPEGFGEPLGAKRPSRMIEIIEVRGRHGGRGWPLRGGKCYFGEEKGSVLGFEYFGYHEAKKGVIPGQNHLFAVLQISRKYLPPRPDFRQFQSRAPRKGRTKWKPEGEEEYEE